MPVCGPGIPIRFLEHPGSNNYHCFIRSPLTQWQSDRRTVLFCIRLSHPGPATTLGDRHATGQLRLRLVVVQFERYRDRTPLPAIHRSGGRLRHFHARSGGECDQLESRCPASHGYSSDEIIRRHFSVFYTEEDRASGKPGHLLAAAALQGRVEDEGWRVRKDGSRFWANVVITAIHNENGGLIGFAKITRDLSERRRLEELERAIATSSFVQQARENEQKRIARELHDDLGQQLTALKMTLALHETELTRHVRQEAHKLRPSIDEIAGLIDGMATSVRRIAAVT